MALIGVGFVGNCSIAYAVQNTGQYLSSDDLDAIDPNLKKQPGVNGQEAFLEKNMLALSKPVSEEELATAELQILLDRSGFSPGAIDGQRSEHLQRVLELYRSQFQFSELKVGSPLVSELLGKAGGSAFEEYILTQDDIRGPFVSEIPKRIQDQGLLKKLNFIRVQELLGERFHMDEVFLERLNPGADFSKAGTIIKVANIGRYLDIRVSKIVAEQDLKQVTAFDGKGRIVAVYPASIGSVQNPSPRGDFTVRNKAGFPAYTLAPDNGFEVMDGNQQVLVAPGPNNPVGIAWIGLSKKTYGIHGTPEPSQIGKSSSNGCIRLTNWDALELAKLVSTGVQVSIR